MNEKKKRVITGMTVLKIIAILAPVVVTISVIVSVARGTPISEIFTNASNIPMLFGVILPVFILHLVRNKKDRISEN